MLDRQPRPAVSAGRRRGLLAAAVVLCTAGVSAVTAVFLPPTNDQSQVELPAHLLDGRAPQPHEVGFLGEQGSLTVIDGPDNAPSGTAWDAGTLRIEDPNGLSLDHVWVKGSVDYYGSGTLRITNSIIEANGSADAVIWGRMPEALLEVSDSTIVWPSSVPPPDARWGSGAIQGDSAMTLVRNDISGTPDGIQQGRGDVWFEQNYIHDLAMLGVYPNHTHNDGIQLYGGPGVHVLYNYIELNGYNGTHQNAALFLSDDGNGFSNPQIIGNYLSGGGYQLRLEAGVQNATVTGNAFGPLAGGFGEATIEPGVTIRIWADNTQISGSPLPQPNPTR